MGDDNLIKLELISFKVFLKTNKVKGTYKDYYKLLSSYIDILSKPNWLSAAYKKRILHNCKVEYDKIKNHLLEQQNEKEKNAIRKRESKAKKKVKKHVKKLDATTPG